MELIKVDNRHLCTYKQAKDIHGRIIIYGIRFIGLNITDGIMYYLLSSGHYSRLYIDRWNKLYFL